MSRQLKCHVCVVFKKICDLHRRMNTVTTPIKTVVYMNINKN